MDLQTPTVHNDARKGQIAKTVIMPGDPMRAKKFAKKFLKQETREFCEEQSLFHRDL